MLLFVLSLLAKDYSDYWLYEVNNPSADLVEELQSYDVWSADKSGMEVFMPTLDFDALNIQDYQVLKKDISELIDSESSRLQRQRRFKRPAPVNPDTVWFESFFVDYSTYDSIKLWYQKLAETFPQLVTFVPSIGKSLEGRDLFAIHLTAPTKTSKKVFYFESLIHAREWISGTTTAYIVWQLIKGYTEEDTKYVNILNQAEFVLVPIVNPDGYSHAHNSDRMWRKNKRTISGRAYGVDLNRNFQDGHWGQVFSTHLGRRQQPSTAIRDLYGH